MRLLAAHAMGDFMFQNRWLARIKTQGLWGVMLHCAIYSATVCVWMDWWDWRGVAVFVTHALIDGLGLGKKVWPDLIDQGSPTDTSPAPMWLRLIMDQSLHFIALALLNA